jgi:hypothetical protein
VDAKPPSPDRVREIEATLTLARWYRSWAEVTDSAGEKAQRLAMAESLELKARKLADAAEC